MQKKENILGKALAKLKIMQRQLVEETRVLSEIKEREYVYPQEMEILKVELSAKERIITRLNEEKKKLQLELACRADEFKALLGKEREKSRAVCEKLEREAAAAKKELLSGIQALKEDANRKNTELIRKSTELIQLNDGLTEAKNKHDLFKKELASGMAKTGELNVLIGNLTDIIKQKDAQLSALRSALEKSGEESSENSGKLKEKDEQLDELGKKLENLKDSMKTAVKGAQNREDTHKHETEKLAVELNCQERIIASLSEKIKIQHGEKESLAAELAEKADEFSALLARERGNFKMLHEKAKSEFSVRENQLLSERREFENRYDSLSGETDRLNTELKNLGGRHDILRKEQESLLKKIDEVYAANTNLTVSLKDSKEAYKTASGAAILELTAREHTIASLEKELEEHKQGSEKLVSELHTQFKALLTKEREGFKTAYQKLESETAGAEKELITENLKLKETLNHKRIEKEEESLKLRQALEKSKEESVKNMERSREKDDHLGQLGKKLETLENNMEKASDEIKRKEDAHRRETEKLKTDLSAKDRLIAELNKEIQEESVEREKSRLELLNRSSQFKRLLDKENKDFSLAYEKMENEFLARERDFFNESRKVKEALSHKCLETDKLTVEMRELEERCDILKSKLEANTIVLQEQGVFSTSSLSALREKEEELTALREKLERAQVELAESFIKIREAQSAASLPKPGEQGKKPKKP